jgi:hypothetical protein
MGNLLKFSPNDSPDNRIYPGGGRQARRLRVGDPKDPATFSKTRMSVWIPLQDADERNGCLWVVPGSHTWGLQPFVEVVDRFLREGSTWP